MDTYTITTESGESLEYTAETRAEAIRAYKSAHPGVGVLAVSAANESRVRASMLD